MMTVILVVVGVLVVTAIDLVCYAKTPIDFRLNFSWRYVPLSGPILYYLYCKDYHKGSSS